MRTSSEKEKISLEKFVGARPGLRVRISFCNIENN
jgi:hypothetical protein